MAILFAFNVYTCSVNDFKMSVSIKMLIMTMPLATLIITPGLNSDPINWIKLCVVTTGVSISFFLFLQTDPEKFSKLPISFLVCYLGVFLGIILSLIFAHSRKVEDFYGVYGRANGFLTYFMLLLVVFLGTQLSPSESLSRIHRVFCWLAPLFLFYILIQFANKDPFAWSRKETFGTLGNINYSSALLGMLVIYWGTYSFLKSSSFFVVHRILVVILSLLAIFVIYKSGSIQGLFGIVYAASVLSAVKFAKKFNRYRRSTEIVWLSIVNVFAVSTIYIASRKDLYHGFIYQETIAFRRDYMVAGLRMMQEFPFFGVGANNYGDWYRAFRDESGAMRTVADRTSNSAHSILIDIGAGTGVLSFLSLLILITIAFIRVVKILKVTKNPQLRAGIMLWLCYFPQFFIGILNFGTSIWAWFIMGLVFNPKLSELESSNLFTSRKELKTKVFSKKGKLTSQNYVLDPGTFMKTLGVGTIALVISAIPVYTDAKYFSYVKRNDLGNALSSALSPLAPTALLEQTLDSYVRSKSPNEILSVALQTTQRFPRSYYGWTVISELAITPDALRNQALSQLMKLNPYSKFP